MKTVLLWGSSWWVPGANEPLPFDTNVQAADVLAGCFRDERPRLRLIYQPDSLETAAATCPKGGRSLLASALGTEFPALAERGCAWGHEPILPSGDAFTTILHFQREPGVLVALFAALENHGFAVESAWPLGTFLSALPGEWTESGANTILAVQKGRACAYRHGADGRAILQWHGDSALAEVREWIRAILGREPKEPLTVVVADEAALNEIGAFEEHATARFISLREVLEYPAVLPRNHPAQLLPPIPFVTAQRAAVTAAVVLLALSGWWGASYTRACLAWRTEGEAREAQKRELRSEVARLRANAAEIATLRATLDGAPAAIACSAFVEKLTATVPPEVALGSLRVSEGKFTVQGFIAPGSLPAGVETWRTKFADPRWVVQPGTGPTPAGTFTFTGEFKS